MVEFVTVAKKAEIAPGRAKVCAANGAELAVFNFKGDFYAISNSCPHRGGSLGEGSCDDQGVVACPWHGFRFDVRTGASPEGLPYSVKPYPVKIQGEEIQVGI